MVSVPSAPDPFKLRDQSPLPNELYDVSGRTPVMWPRSGTTGVLLCIGDSLFGNTVDGTYTPTNLTKALNLAIGNGGVFQCKDPLLGADNVGGNVLTPLADKLAAAAAFDPVVMVPIALGGASIVDWAAGGKANYRIQVAQNRILAAGLTVSQVLITLGTNDGGMSQATYAANQDSLISSIRAAGINAHIVIAQSTFKNGVTSTGIRAAQAAVVNHTNGIYAGPDTDAFGLSSRQADGTHWNSTGVGAVAVADAWKTAVQAAI